MLIHESKKGYILISTEIQAEFERLSQELKPNRVVGFIEDDFKIEHAKAVVAEAYISEAQTKYIIIGSSSFTNVAQNSLLKVLEEPPKNIEFIIISPTKSNLLPTVRSRLPIVKGKIIHSVQNIELNLAKIDYAEVFAFLKANARITKSDAKTLVEALYYRATVVDMLILSISQLDNFDRAYRLLELNSRPQSVLALILMSFVGDKNAG
ncbi:DNA polymerase III subunit delta' [Candidatus Sulfurimonas baltica]|uniref:DNA polymerase III subunit delta n=1 Tax=Candidatus Sulfurimonas baltica TaxID=2740404 RepID=A0A7S7LUC1_9BACT|nr:DNA polymerase III subunit delta' [Candidatus Sulfurimonas baltica]QOY51470.1 DNA polymerase III subunit delta' [Candidatus Sulfurimonas baltica]